MSSTSQSPDRTAALPLTAVFYGVLCHTLFAVGVGTMIVAMFFGMSGSFGRVAAPWSVLADAVLLVQFPVLHSGLLSRFGMPALKRLAPRAIAGNMVTTTYAMVASVQVFLLFALWTPSGVIWWRATGAAFPILVALYAASWFLLLKAIWDAGIALQTGLLGWWAVAHRRRPVFPPMPTRGLFKIVRQPIYVAFALTLWTVPVWTPDQLTVALVLTGYCIAGPLLKERRFRERFGDAFASYARHVPYWVPWPRPPVRRNDLSIYDAPPDWRDDRVRWLRALRNLVPVRFRYFDPTVGDWRGLAVLDLGCGGGLMSEALAERGAIVTGVDPSAAAIAAAARHASTSGLTIDYRAASGERLPFASGSFDVVVCVDVLEHVTDVDGVLAEVHRVLRPGGTFLFDTINRNWLASFVMVTLAENVIRMLPRGAHDPAMFIRPSELAQKLEAADFQVRPFVGMAPVRLTRRLDPVFALLPTTAVQYAGCAVSRPTPAPAVAQ